MGAALGTDGTLGADGGLGALGADGTLGATGAPPDGGEIGGEGVVGATLNLLQQRGIGDRPVESFVDKAFFRISYCKREQATFGRPSTQ
jgi:hypothetical protein